MTDAERAHRIVEDFRADGHAYYDELLAPIEFALAAVRRDERRDVATWLRSIIEPLQEYVAREMDEAMEPRMDTVVHDVRKPDAVVLAERVIVALSERTDPEARS